LLQGDTQEHLQFATAVPASMMVIKHKSWWRTPASDLHIKDPVDLSRGAVHCLHEDVPIIVPARLAAKKATPSSTCGLDR
jgi:hypothetical protein